MKKYILLLALLLSSTTFAVEPKFNDNFKQTKNEIETSSPGKIEVLELFWYGCIHCYSMDPYLDKWAEALSLMTLYLKEYPLFPERVGFQGQRLTTHLKRLV